MKTIGEQIKQLRVNKGWSQMRLSKEVNTSQPAISMAESEQYEKLTIATLKRIAEILGKEMIITLI